MDEQNTTPRIVVSPFEAQQAVILARLDERTQHLVSTLSDFRNQIDKQITDLKEDAATKYKQLKVDSDQRLSDVKKEIDDKLDGFSEELASKVSNDAFEPVKLITYGLAGAILLAVVGALLTSINIGGDKAPVPQVIQQYDNTKQKP